MGDDAKGNMKLLYPGIIKFGGIMNGIGLGSPCVGKSGLVDPSMAAVPPRGAVKAAAVPPKVGVVKAAVPP